MITEIEDREPSFHNPVIQVCTQKQMETARFQFWMDKLGMQPTYWRHLWELAYIAEVLYNGNMLKPGSRGIAFGCGNDPLVSLFASFGCQIIASDFQSNDVVGQGWASHHKSNLETLWYPAICSKELYDANVSFREIDMANLPNDLGEFDFIWSTCALEHIAPHPLVLGPKFIINSFNLLLENGLAVHTTEFNVSSNDATIEAYFERGDGSVEGATALFRRKDILSLLQYFDDKGISSTVNWNTGSGQIDNEIDGPVGQWKRFHEIKAVVGHNTDPRKQYVTTSIGLYFKKQ